MPKCLLHLLLAVLLAVTLALPWVWPFTAGPSAAVEPYLVAAVAAALLLALWPLGAAELGALEDGGAAGIAAAGWLLAALLSSGIALLQYFHREETFFPWIDGSVPGQAFGNLRQPNLLATLLMIGLLALRWSLARTGRTVVSTSVAALAALLLLAALAATASRVGLVELLLLGALTLWWARPGTRWRALAFAAAALLCYALAALALPWLLQSSEGLAGRALVDRLEHAESTCGSRLILWRNVLHLIAAHPWAGWWDRGGLIYAHYITLYDGPRFCHILDNAHNLPLHLAVELGVPAALLACALALWLIWRGRPWAETDPGRQLAWGVLGAIALHSMVEYPLWYGPFQTAALLSLWLLWRTRRQPAPATDQGGALAAARYALAALVLAVCAYAGWDYRRVSQIYLPQEERAAAYRTVDPLAEAQKSWLFAGMVRFADLTMQRPTRDNAGWMLPTALQSLYFSPEPRVIERVIESASWLGQDDLALAHMARFKAAFPQEYQTWSARNHQPATAPQEPDEELDDED